MSYESCARHEGEEATNGCAKCAAEKLERDMQCLDNFLADHFGGDGERRSTLRFLEALKKEGFDVTVRDTGETL